MVLLLLPLDAETIGLLRFYDNLICVIFLIDFFLNLRAASKTSDYLIRERGWLDLLGSIPSFGLVAGLTGRLAGLLRLARLSRLARIARLLRGEGGRALVKDVVANRGQYAAFITILLTLLVLTASSVLVLQFKSRSPDAHIQTGWDAFWYSIVTITAVGYGDFYPVTVWGRITGMLIMFMGVGIIGALASILSSVLVGSSSAPAEEVAPAAPSAAGATPAISVEQELASIKSELAALRQFLEETRAREDR